MDVPTDFARSISAATLTLYERRTVDETLQTIAEVASNSVPRFDQVGISTLHDRGQVVTRAFIGDLVLRLDEIQYGLWEGPCVDTLRGSDVVTVPGLRYEQRWAQYVPQAVALGVKSHLALRLRHADDTIGSINLYSTVSDEVSQNALALAELFTTHAVYALGHAQQRESLTEALQSRKIIGEAIGILMERYDVNEDRAFAFLVRASSHTNIELRAVAQELVDERNSVLGVTMIMRAGFATPCADCGATTQEACADTCRSRQATTPSSVSLPRAERREVHPVRGAELGEREGLNAHEGDIVSLIVLGLSNQEIAGALDMSMHSVKTHLRSAYRKMGVASRTQAISWGVHHGFRLTAPAARLNDGVKQ